MEAIYTAHGTATGGGRSGTSATDDGRISVNLSVPKEMGGDGGPGTNPEQLFAVGYAACFLGAIRASAGQLKITIPDDATVTCDVSFGKHDSGNGFGIAAALTANAPGMDSAEWNKVVEAAHKMCPYSNLIRDAGDAKVTATV